MLRYEIIANVGISVDLHNNYTVVALAKWNKEKESYSRNPNLLKIYVPKDTFGIYVNTITFRNEYEMLIAPNYYLRLVEYPYKDHATEKTIYECKLFSLSY